MEMIKVRNNITIISNIDTMQFFVADNHCEEHNLGDAFVPCTYSLPMFVTPRDFLPSGIIKSKEDLVNVFYDDMVEIPNPNN